MTESNELGEIGPYGMDILRGVPGAVTATGVMTGPLGLADAVALAERQRMKIDQLESENESLRHIIEDRIMDDKCWRAEYNDWLKEVDGDTDRRLP